MHKVEVFDGCYEGHRAAALSGVPKSTVYYWARTGVVTPSVSPVREKLWSYADLMTLRIVYWLRHPEISLDGRDAASPMPQVRRALEQLLSHEVDLWQPDREVPVPLLVDRAGRIYVHEDGLVSDLAGQEVVADVLDLLAPFEVGELHGPDLRRPRASLRIIPGKCSGEPHLAGTRLTTPALAALDKRGYEFEDILRLYPDEDPQGIRDAVDLERQLAA